MAKEKKKILVNKGSFIALVVAIVGVLLFSFSSFILLNDERAKSFNKDNFSENTFYKLEVDNILGKKATDATKQVFYVSDTSSVLFIDVDYYTVPVGDDKYILLGVSNSNTKNKLNAFKDGIGSEKITINAVLMKGNNINTEWYSTIQGFSTNQIIEGYYLRETSTNTYANYVALSSLLFLSSYVVYFAVLCPAFKKSERIDTLDITTVGAYAQEDIVLDLRIEQLYEKHKKYKLRQKLLSLRLVFSSLMVIAAIFFLILQNNETPLRVISAAFIIWFIVEFVNWLINHSEGLSMKLQEKHPVKSNFMILKDIEEKIKLTNKAIDDYHMAQEEKYRVDNRYIDRN